MRHILHSTYYLAAAGLLGLITLPALAQEAGTDANESHQAGIAANTESPLPKTITVLVDQGFTFHGIFEAPDDLQGYALSYDNEPMAAYISSSSDYAVIGTLIDPFTQGLLIGQDRQGAGFHQDPIEGRQAHQ